MGLLHRNGAGWVEVGAVALDNPDLPEALGYLRSTALGLSPRGLATKLIIPNDQILYTEVIAPGPDDASRLAQIRVALEGRTPYDVSDLAFDWSAQGDLVQVAVIARETLAEAEAFAAEHRFNPVAFVALPQDQAFQGEPWFGPTAFAATLLTSGETVERDAAPVNLVARGFSAGSVPAPEELPHFVPEPVFEPEPDAIPATEPEFVPQPAPMPEEIPTPEPEYLPEPDYPAEPEFIPQEDPPFSEPDALPQLDDRALNPALAEPAPLAPQPVTEADEAPMALDVADEEPEVLAQPRQPATARVTDPGIDDELPPAPSASAMVAFSSRRFAEDAPRGKSPALGAAKSAVARPSIAKPLPPVAGAAERPVVARPVAARPVAARPVSAPPPPRPSAAVKPNAADKALRDLGALVMPPTAAGGRKAKAPIPAALQTAPKPAQAQATPPRPGIGLGGKPAPVRGKPRHLGLIMTAVLLMFLALVAAWSSYSLAFWQGSDPAVETAMMNAETPAPDDEMLADMQDPAELAAANTAAQLAEPALEPAPESTLEPAPQTVDELAVALENAPGALPQDEILLATMDAPPNAPDALALPKADARGDTLPSAQPAPPPFGTVYQFDADGLIRPTPEGIVTPEGVLLIAGKPPRVPEPRPADVTAAAALGAAPPAADAPLPVNPALQGKRSQPRPEGLVPAAPADQGALAPSVDSRLAGLRPQARPTTTLAAGEEARLASASASLAALPEASLAPDSLRSTMAVAISRKPEARPQDESESLEAVIAAAIRATEPEPEVVETAPARNAAPEADNEPEVVAAAPSIPTRASVAKQATFKNAINLSKVNLIGVYGTDSNRHALIRQTNGRFKKVRVGDKIDGGQIAAITGSEVRYKKGGKMVTLAMPKG